MRIRMLCIVCCVLYIVCCVLCTVFAFRCYVVCCQDIPGMIRRQRDVVTDKIDQLSTSRSVHGGLTCFREGKRSVNIEDIPGVLAAGWKPSAKECRASLDPSPPLTELTAKLSAVMKLLKKCKDAWPFLAPVTGVDDYYVVIKEPMDFSTVEERLRVFFYKTPDMFVHDIKLVVNNCRKYNDSASDYYGCANTVEALFLQLMQKQDLPVKDYKPKLVDAAMDGNSSR